MGKNKKKGGRYQDTIYRQINAARAPNVVRRIVLSVTGTIASDGAGVIAGAISMNPSGSSEWSSFAVIYDQFRVLGGVLNLMCTRPLNDTGAPTIVRFAFDNDSTATPTSYGDVMQFAEVTDVPSIWTSGTIMKVPFKRPVKSGTVQSQFVWYDEATPSASPGSLKYYGSGANATTGFMRYVLDYLVEFQVRS